MLKLSIIVPPLVLVLIGAAAYIVVVKTTAPQPIVVKGQPQSSMAAQASSSSQASVISTNVRQPTASQIRNMQQLADSGNEAWRLDPLSAAKYQSLEYGFATDDVFSLSQTNGHNTPTITAHHHSETYLLAMVQPDVKGDKGIWLISTISRL